MKKSLFLVIAVLSVSMSICNAQTLNTLGIGIGTPIGTLHVHSSTAIQDESGFQPLGMGVTPNHYESSIHLSNANTGSTKNDGFLIKLSDGNLTMQHQENNNFNIYGSSGKGISIVSSGNVGIGTVNPSSRLHLHGSAKIDSMLTVSIRTDVGSGAYTVSLGKANSSNLADGLGYIGFNAMRSGNTWTCKGNTLRNGGAVIWATQDGDILFANIGSTGSANQTLGDAQVKSHVNMKLGSNGLLQVKEVKVSISASDWPDYVFKKGYELRTLEKTEEYIKDNGHLPGVPSAGEIEEQGLSLGEINRILLQKVEELTLQVIELNKQVKELKGE